MKEYPLITIITLSYRHFEHLYHTINSVLLQDYPHIEYIIADDGSPNFPANEIEEFIQSRKSDSMERLQIIIRPSNVGTVRNFNDAIMKSSGKYILPLSCNDSFSNSHVVSQIVDEFERTGCGVVIASRVVCDSDYQPRCVLPYHLEQKSILNCQTAREQYELYVSGRLMDMISGSVAYYRKSVLEHYGYFDESYRLLEDAPFFERFLWDNAVNFRYDITSIFYDGSGVSSKKQKNSLFDIDYTKYRMEQRFSHIHEVSPRLRRILYYSKARYYARNVFEKLRCYLTYFDIFIYHVFYRLRRKVYRRLDRHYLKKLRIQLIEYHF